MPIAPLKSNTAPAKAKKPTIDEQSQRRLK